MKKKPLNTSSKLASIHSAAARPLKKNSSPTKTSKKLDLSSGRKFLDSVHKSIATPILNETWLLIGNGRLARHLRCYLESLGFVGDERMSKPSRHFQSHKTESKNQLAQWYRPQSQKKLQSLLQIADRILLCLPDRELESFFLKHRDISPGKWVHFSGAQEIQGMDSAHPLMSFPQQTFDQKTYEKICWAVPAGKRLSDVLPGLNNPYFQIEKANRSLYHAFCVMTGNFPLIMAEMGMLELKKMGVQEESASLYVSQVFSNWQSLGSKALTGPLVRGDFSTLEKHLHALSSSKELRKYFQLFSELYELFPQTDFGAQVQRDLEKNENQKNSLKNSGSRMKDQRRLL